MIRDANKTLATPLCPVLEDKEAHAHTSSRARMDPHHLLPCSSQYWGKHGSSGLKLRGSDDLNYPRTRQITALFQRLGG